MTTKLKAKLYLYLNTPISNINNGVYTSIGFGTTLMLNSDILLCAVTKTTQWCKDYTGLREDISPKSSITNVISSKVSTLDSVWSPYVTQVVWEIERTMDPTPYINGTKDAIYAYGSLNSSGTPQEHPGGYYGNISTGDGNTRSPPAATTTTETTTTTTSASTTGTTTTGTTNTSTTGTTTTTTTSGTTTTETTKPKGASFLKTISMFLVLLFV